jgi:hypothetical protein
LSAICSLGFSQLSQRDSLSLPPARATRKQRTNQVGRSTSHNFRFARSLATPFDAAQPHILTFVCPHKSVDGKRACTLLAGTQDKASRDSTYDVTLAERRAGAYLSSRKTKISVHVDNIFFISSS